MILLEFFAFKINMFKWKINHNIYFMILLKIYPIHIYIIINQLMKFKKYFIIIFLVKSYNK